MYSVLQCHTTKKALGQHAILYMQLGFLSCMSLKDIRNTWLLYYRTTLLELSLCVFYDLE